MHKMQASQGRWGSARPTGRTHHAAAAALVVRPAHKADLLDLSIPSKHGQQVLLGASGGDLPHKQARHACGAAEGGLTGGAARHKSQPSCPQLSSSCVLGFRSVLVLQEELEGAVIQQRWVPIRRASRQSAGGRCAQAPARQRASPAKPPRALFAIKSIIVPSDHHPAHLPRPGARGLWQAEGRA